MPIAQILIQQFPLRVSCLGFELLDLGIDVTVANQDVRPAIIVHVEEAASPAEELCVSTKSRGKGRVFETSSANIVIKRRRISREVRLHDIEIAIHVIVGSGNSHAGLRLAIWAESASGFDRDVFELAVLLVVIERAGGGVVRDIDVRPAVVIKISGKHAESVRSGGTGNSCRLRDVGKSAVAVIVVKNVLAALKTRRPARDHDALVEARS